MSDVIGFESADSGGLLPVECKLPGGVATRLARQEDFAWIDALQKENSKCVGFRREVEIRKRIETGDVIVAEAKEDLGLGISDLGWEAGGAGGEEAPSGGRDDVPKSAIRNPQSPMLPAGYCMGVDKYMQQGHVGIIYQMCVPRKFRRSLVAASLLQARFDTSAYGTTLYSCWCRQDLDANRFWEAMGFVPIAFRAAGRSTLEKMKKKQGTTRGGVHIFWQKKVRACDQNACGVGDTSGGWWYPYETRGGAMMAGRVCLPIPPGVHWSEVMPAVLPGSEERERELKLLEDAAQQAKKAARPRKGSRPVKQAPRGDAAVIKRATGPVSAGGFGVGVKVGDAVGQPDAAAEAQKAAAAEVEQQTNVAEALEAQRAAEAAKAEFKAARRKNDPFLVAHARELRDKWQEHVAENPALLENKSAGKYDVTRTLGPAQVDLALGAGCELAGPDDVVQRIAA